MTEVLDQKKHKLLKFLDSVRTWSEEDACVTRRANVELHGLPLHGWSLPNMEKILNVWVEVVEIDGRLADPDDFDAPQAIIDTTSFKRIQDWAVLEFDGMRFDILIQEVSSQNNQLHSISAGFISRARQEKKFEFQIW